MGLGKDCNANSATIPEPAAVVSVAVPGRQMYVAGIFASAETARAAVTTLQAFADGIVIVSSEAFLHDTDLAATNTGYVAYILDRSILVETGLTSVLAGAAPFSAIVRGDERTPHHGFLGPERFLQGLSHHLATGATAVIARARDPQCQLRASRKLLDAKCDALFTHDILQAIENAQPASEADEGCCDSCTNKSCRRVAPQS